MVKLFARYQQNKQECVPLRLYTREVPRFHSSFLLFVSIVIFVVLYRPRLMYSEKTEKLGRARESRKNKKTIL